MSARFNCRPQFLLIAVLAPALIVSGCSRPKARGPETPQVAAGTAVSVVPAQVRDITKTLSVTGSLVPLNDVVVAPRAGGTLMAVHVREGDSVQAGQVVAVMDLTDYRAQLDSARAALEAAQTREKQARLVAEQARNQLGQAELNLEVTETSTAAGLAVARASLASAEQALAVIRQGARPQEREQAEQQVRAAKANLDKLASDLKRMRELHRDQAISTSQLEQVQAAYDAAEAQYKSALESLSLIREGARKEDIRRAELAVEQAQEGLRKAEADRRLVDVRKRDVATARAAVQSAEEGVAAAAQATRQAKAAVQMAQHALDTAIIRSPLTGYVAARLAEPGQQLGGGTPVLRIVAPGSVYFQASVSESEYADVAVGQQVEVTVDALPGETFAGKVTKIFPMASPAARSFPVRIDFRRDDRLRPQMFARGKIIVGTHKNAVVVPKDAVLFGETDGDARVFVVSADNKAQERAVRLGFVNADVVEIVAGVRQGEKVVTAGQNTLRDGDRVVVR